MSPRILIIEDQRPLLEAMTRLLSRLQVTVETAGDGIEGLHKFTANPSDLIITALKIPSLNGVDLIRRIRATPAGKGLPIIIITAAYKGPEYRQRAKAMLGVDFYLEKPFTQSAFLDAVQKSLGPRLTAPPAKPAPTPAPAPAIGARVPSPAPPLIKPTQTPAPGARAIPPASSSQPLAKPTPAPAPGPRAIPPTSSSQPLAIQPRPAIRGNLKQMPLASLLLEARDKRATGVMFIRKSDDQRQILFVNGLPLGSYSSQEENTFGNFLFRQGKISLMEYQAYLRQADHGGDDVFIKMGALDPAQFQLQWLQALEEAVIELFAWTEAEFTLQLWPALPEPTPAPPMNLARIIHQGYQRHLAAPRLEAIKKSAAGRFPALTGAYFDHRLHLAPSPAEVSFLEAADGAHPLEGLIPEDPQAADQLWRGIGAFLALGMIELREKPSASMVAPPFPIRADSLGARAPSPAQPSAQPTESEPEPETESEEPEPAPEEEAENFDDLRGELDDEFGDVVAEAKPAPAAPTAASDDAQAGQDRLQQELAAFHQGLKDKNYYEIFGMKPNRFDFAKFKEEYFRRTKQFSPEHFLSSSGAVLQQAEDTLSILATAYNTLSNVVSKEKYDEMLQEKGPAGVPGAKDHDQMQAEVAFQSGMAFLEMADWDGAEKSLGEAANFAPHNSEVLSHYAYALYNKNRKSISIQKRVNELLAKAIKLNPKCYSAFAYRGALLLEDEKVTLAEADFKKALSIKPQYRFALKGLKKIEQKKQDEKKGLFARFRK
jgi:CheY-like chemotaxis protein/tetratricopeptide (TPR) repeat protein